MIFSDTLDSWDEFDDEEHGSFDEIPDDGFLFGELPDEGWDDKEEDDPYYLEDEE